MSLRSRYQKSLIIAGILSAIILPSAFLHQTAHAQASTDAANGLQISPALVELDAEKGKTYTVELKVLNVTGSNLSFTSTVNDFAAKDETGTPSILLNETTPLPTSIQTWVETIPAFSLAPHQTQTIEASISVPANAEPGGHYGIIRFSGSAPSLTSTGVGLSASAGTLFLVRVAGDITEHLNLITFEATDANGNPHNLFEYGPINFLTRFQNTGNVHVIPSGKITVHDIFGNSVATMDVNDQNGNILPDSIRRFESSFNKQWLFGHYTADISIAYGTTGGAIVESTSFWVIPWKLILIGLAILATVIYVLRFVIKRYNKYIIAQAQKSTEKTKKSKNKKK
jgi:hypothetical protein